MVYIDYIYSEYCTEMLIHIFKQFLYVSLQYLRSQSFSKFLELQDGKGESSAQQKCLKGESLFPN